MTVMVGPTSILRGIGLRQVRITCGIVLFAYLVSHYTCHALGNISYAAMAEGLKYHIAFWRNPVVTAVFYTAALTHWGLGLWALYERRQVRYTASEVTQLLLGLSIPVLLVIHFVGVRMPTPLFGYVYNYTNPLYAYWVARPWQHWLQFVLIIVAWIHGCIGLYYWLRLKRSFVRAAPLLLAFAVLLPVLAIIGVEHGARTVVELMKNPQYRAANFIQPTPPQRALLDDLIYIYFPIGYATVLGLVFAARGVRNLRERRQGMITLSYSGGRSVRAPRGYSVLEASLRCNIPHASVCGGKARCSTCRIRVLDNPSLPPPSRREAFVLERVGAGGNPAIRLACQLRPEKGVPVAAAAAVEPVVCARAKHASGRGALPDQHVRRPAWIDADRRTRPAIRHRVPGQPFSRRGGEGSHRSRWPAKSVPGRRHACAVRTRHRP
jgi:adenylate cyclase